MVGTAEPVCAASAEPREDPTMLVECHPHADPAAWLLENPGFVSGGNLRWCLSVETTATGAAILAAVGAGAHATVAEAVDAFVAYQPQEQVPDPERRERYDDAYRRYREVYFALKPVFERG